MIRSGFGKFFGMIHVLTRHLAPELDRFLFCPGFWSMLHFDRKLDIFGDVLTHGHNWAKMRNKEKRPHAKDRTERGQKGPRPAGAGLGPSGPAGLAHSVSCPFITSTYTPWRRNRNVKPNDVKQGKFVHTLF